jgi:hypothetical protein
LSVGPSKSRRVSVLLFCWDDILANCLNGSFGDGVSIFVGFAEGGASGSRSSKSVFLSATPPFNWDWRLKDESSDSSFLRVENSWWVS